MLLSILGPTIRCIWHLPAWKEAMVTTVSFRPLPCINKIMYLILKPANSILTCFSAQHSPTAMNNWQTSPFMKTRELVYKETKLFSYSTFMHSLSLVWSCENYAKLKGVVIDEFKCGRQYCQSYALKRMECWRLFGLHVLVPSPFPSLLPPAPLGETEGRECLWKPDTDRVLWCQPNLCKIMFTSVSPWVKDFCLRYLVVRPLKTTCTLSAKFFI